MTSRGIIHRSESRVRRVGIKTGPPGSMAGGPDEVNLTTGCGVNRLLPKLVLDQPVLVAGSLRVWV